MVELASNQAPASEPVSVSAKAGSEVPARSVGRVPGLDGMRGVAAIIVFTTHLDVILPIHRLAVVPGETVSLDSFFVLSGFLITALLLREQARTKTIDSPSFYRRRAMRLLPPLIAVLLAQAVFAYMSGVSYHQEWTSLLSVGFYYSNWKLAFNSNALGGNIAPGLQHLWSLALEEQFYLVWPWVTIYFLTIRARLRTVVVVLVTLIIAIAVHRALMYHGVNSWYADFIRTDTRADGILLGCLVAHLWVRGREPKRAIAFCGWAAAIFLALCLPFVDATGAFQFDGGISAIDLACALLILAILDGRWRGSTFFNFRGFVILGTVSYAFYLWHLPIFFAIRYYGGGWEDWVRVTVAVTATLTMTALSWLLIEKPALDWKDRLEGHNPAERLSLATLFGRKATVIHGDAPVSSGADSPVSGHDDPVSSGSASANEPEPLTTLRRRSVPIGGPSIPQAKHNPPSSPPNNG